MFVPNVNFAFILVAKFLLAVVVLVCIFNIMPVTINTPAMLRKLCDSSAMPDAEGMQACNAMVYLCNLTFFKGENLLAEIAAHVATASPVVSGACILAAFVAEVEGTLPAIKIGCPPILCYAEDFAGRLRSLQHEADMLHVLELDMPCFADFHQISADFGHSALQGSPMNPLEPLHSELIARTTPSTFIVLQIWKSSIPTVQN